VDAQVEPADDNSYWFHHAATIHYRILERSR
jgi:hypothetical protein